MWMEDKMRGRMVNKAERRKLQERGYENSDDNSGQHDGSTEI